MCWLFNLQDGDKLAWCKHLNLSDFLLVFANWTRTAQHWHMCLFHMTENNVTSKKIINMASKGREIFLFVSLRKLETLLKTIMWIIIIHFQNTRTSEVCSAIYISPLELQQKPFPYGPQLMCKPQHTVQSEVLS